jgi:hypothetical protein
MDLLVGKVRHGQSPIVPSRSVRSVGLIVLGLIAALLVATTYLALHVRAQGHALEGLIAERSSTQRDTGEKEIERFVAAGALANAVRAQGQLGQTVKGSPNTARVPTAQDPVPSDGHSADRKELQDRYANAFSTEPVDSAWARDRAGVLSTRIKVVLPNSSVLKSIECHSTTCRLETVHDNIESFNAFVEGAFTNRDTRLTTGASFSKLQKDGAGKLTIVTYLASEGGDLPHNN